MAKKCPITKKTLVVGGGYSNRTRATKYNPTGKSIKKLNFQKKKIFIPSLKKTISVNISVKGLRTMKKNGIEKELKKANLI